MLLVDEEEDYRFSYFNLYVLFNSKQDCLKAHSTSLRSCSHALKIAIRECIITPVDCSSENSDEKQKKMEQEAINDLSLFILKPLSQVNT